MANTPSGVRGLGPVKALAALSGTLLAAWATGCGSGEQPRDAAGPSAGLNTLSDGGGGTLPDPDAVLADKPTPSELEAMAEKAAADLQAVLDRAASAPSQPAPAPPPPSEPVNATATPAAPSPAPDDGATGAGLAALAAESAAPGPAPAEGDSGVRELAERLRGEIATGTSPLDPALRLAALESAYPALGSSFDDPFGAVRRALSPAEFETVSAVRKILGRAPAGATPQDVGEALRVAQEQMSASMALRLPRVVLCSRVRGFGNFTPIKDATFRAGRPARAALYIEIEGFTHKDQPPGEDGSARWSVEVSRELTLMSGSLVVWRRAPESVKEVGYNKRRDFFLVEEITLPATLGAGMFELKVTVRDEASPAGAVAEKIIPVRLVAE